MAAQMSLQRCGMPSGVGVSLLRPRSSGTNALRQASLRRCNHTGRCTCVVHRLKVSNVATNGVVTVTENGAKPKLPPTQSMPLPPTPPQKGRDDKKETFRANKLRTVYDFPDWAHHRSNGRFARHILGMLNSGVVTTLAGPILYTMSIATGLCIYETLLASGVLPDASPDLAVKSLAPFGLSSFALSLLLVFRTNAAYERWDGARKMWGLVVNRSRDLARQGLVWIKDPELQEAHARWVKAISKSMCAHFRTDRNMEEMLAGVLTPREIEMVVKSGHGPHFVLNVITQIQDKASLGIAEKRSLDQNVTNFSDCIGGCERILRTPIPLSYTRHTSRFLIMWLTFVPFTLWDSCGWATIFYTGITAFLLLGVDDIGVSIEEPFSILPLETISATIERNINGMQTYDKVEGFAAIWEETGLDKAVEREKEKSRYTKGSLYEVFYN